ncbi:hypothetical protein HYV71_03590 [Candidatus Uhrbacteria bacterium]|nr:hypothetical protein [Candidatus Uhrbacteria bacterium]
MKKREHIHDEHSGRKKEVHEWAPPISREDRAHQRVHTLTRAAEHWIAKAEHAFVGVPGAESLLHALRERVRSIRAEAQERILRAELRYGKEYVAHRRDALGAMVKQETPIVDAFLQDPRMFDTKLGMMIQSMKLAQAALQSDTLEKNQRAYYEQEIRDTQRIVYTIYLGHVRKDARKELHTHSSSFKEESVLAVRDDIEKSGILPRYDKIAPEIKEQFLKRLLLAQERRKEEHNIAINKHAQAVVLDRLIAGAYRSEKNQLKAAQEDFTREVEHDQGAPLGEFPPDMSFAYGALAFDKPDFLDQVERFLASEVRKRRTI